MTTATQEPETTTATAPTESTDVTGDSDFAAFSAAMDRNRVTSTDGAPPTDPKEEATGKGSESPTHESESASDAEPKQDTPETGDEGEPEAEAKEAFDFASVLGDSHQVQSRAKSLGLDGRDADTLLEAAIDALKRDDILDADQMREMFTKDPAAFVAKGLKRAKVQRDTDRLYGEQGQQRTKPDEGDTKPDADGDNQAKPAGKADPTDGDAAVSIDIEGILADLQESEFHADLEPVFKGILSSVNDSVQKQVSGLLAHVEGLETQVGALHTQLGEAQARTVEAELANQRSRLTDRFPQLSDDDAYQRVLGRYDAVVETGRFNTVTDAFEEAARWELGEQSTQSIKEQLIQRAAGKRAGSASKPNASNAPKVLTKDETDLAAFNEVWDKHHGPLAGRK